MANSLDNIKYKIIARALMVLRENAVMPRLVNGDYSMEAAEKGDTIDVPIPSAVSVTDVVPGPNQPTPTDTSVNKEQVALDQWKKNEPIFLTDKEMLEIDKNEHFLPMQLEEAVRGLASNVNQYILGKYKDTDRGIYGWTGTEGTTPFGSGVGTLSAINARKVLHSQLCPRSMRRGVLDLDAEAAALALSEFADAEKVGSASVKLEGEIGRKFGIDWLSDQEVLTHTAGTIADASAGRTCAVNNGGGYAIGDDTIDVDNGAEASVTGTITLGDVISFAGHDQTYVIIENTSSAQYSSPDYTFAANAIAGLKFYPALKSAVADDEVITVKDDHVVNIVFHRDAFAFAQRPLMDNKIEGVSRRNLVAVQDPQTGIILRMEILDQYKQTAWEFDILYGAKLVRPEMAMRIAG